MSVELIRKHRKELMAIAMLWIAFYHSYFPINSKAISFVLCNCGYGGVDMFLLLSSFGLYYAYKKNSDFKYFIKRRLLRVLPYSVSFFIILYFFKRISLNDVFWFSSGLSIFYRSDLLYWFVSLILILYFLTPLYLRLFSKNPLKVSLIAIIVLLIVCFSFKEYRYFYMYFRIINYLFGFLLAYINDSNLKEEYKFLPIILIVLLVVGWIMMYCFYHFYRNDILHVFPFAFIIPGSCILLSWIVEKISFIQKPLKLLGNYTFQFYLIHEQMISFVYSNYERLFIPGIGFDWWINLLTMVISFVLAMLFKYIVEKVLGLFNRKLCR